MNKEKIKRKRGFVMNKEKLKEIFECEMCDVLTADICCREVDELFWPGGAAILCNSCARELGLDVSE